MIRALLTRRERAEIVRLTAALHDAESRCWERLRELDAVSVALDGIGAPPASRLCERVGMLGPILHPSPKRRGSLTASEATAYAALTATPGRTAREYGRDIVVAGEWWTRHLAAYPNSTDLGYHAENEARHFTSLHRKGWARRERDGASFRYWPVPE